MLGTSRRPVNWIMSDTNILEEVRKYTWVSFWSSARKNSDLEEKFCKYKMTGCLHANKLYDHNCQYAICQVLGSAPATLQAANVADLFRCLPGHAIEVVDAEQAYIQTWQATLLWSGFHVLVENENIPSFDDDWLAR